MNEHERRAWQIVVLNSIMSEIENKSGENPLEVIQNRIKKIRENSPRRGRPSKTPERT